MDEPTSSVGGPSEEDAAERQKRLGKNIVRLLVFLAGLVVIGRLNILTGGVEEQFVALSIFAVIIGVPLLIGMIVVFFYRRSQLER